MDVTLPSDCGNSPRMTLVGEFVTAWAKHDGGALAERLDDTAEWSIIGRGDFSGSDVTRATAPPIDAERLTVHSVITHGRLASCDGTLETADSRVHFSHVLRFASTSKTARIVELRTYYVESA